MRESEKEGRSERVREKRERVRTVSKPGTANGHEGKKNKNSPPTPAEF